METWKILVITILSAVVLGCVIGVIIGKHQVKKTSGHYRPLLSVKERIIYSACILLGAGCVLFGVFFKFPASQNPGDNQSVIDGGKELPGGVLEGNGDGANPGIEAFAGGATDGEEQTGEDEGNGEDDNGEADSTDGETETAAEGNVGTASITPRTSAGGGGGGVVIVEGPARAVRIG